MAYVARGAIDCFQLDAIFPWDVAAGIVIVREAGGTVQETKGTILQIGSLITVIVPQVHKFFFHSCERM